MTCFSPIAGTSSALRGVRLLSARCGEDASGCEMLAGARMRVCALWRYGAPDVAGGPRLTRRATAGVVAPLLTSSSAANFAAVCRKAMQSKEFRAGVGPMSPASGGEGDSSDGEVLLSGHRGAPGAARRTSSEPTPRGVRLARYPGDASNVKVVPTAHCTNASGMARAIAWTALQPEQCAGRTRPTPAARSASTVGWMRASNSPPVR